eukprot:2197_1
MSTWNSVITTYCISTIILYVCESSYDFTTSSIKLPGGACSGSAAGYDDQNDIVLIFGGQQSPQQFIQFKNNQFIYYNASYLASTQIVQGSAQNYFQINNTLWIIHREGTHFITVSTHPPYDVTVPDINIPIIVDDDGCLAMTQSHVFVVGGTSNGMLDALDNVQIYDIVSDKWLLNVPLLPTARLAVACYVIDDILYAIGGIDALWSQYDSILTLNVSGAALKDISSQQWHVSSAKLNTRSGGCGVIKHGTDLIIIGGAESGLNGIEDVNVINTVTGRCDLAGSLNSARFSAAVVLDPISSTLYVFGGGNAMGTVVDSWEFINLPTVDPTHSSTNFTTSSKPTIAPTLKPSLPPASIPTARNAQLHATLPPHRTIEYETTGKMMHHTTGATENDTATKQDTGFLPIEVVIVLVAVSVCLCLLIVISVMFNRKQSLKRERNMSELTVNQNLGSNSNDATDNALQTGEENKKREEGNKVPIATVDVTAGAMMKDKIVMGLISTNKAGDVVEKDGEKDDVQIGNIAEDSSSSQSLFDNQATTGESMQLEHCDTTK